MAKLTDLDPRLAGYDDADSRPRGSFCELCNRSAEVCVVDKYSGGFFCDNCIGVEMLAADHGRKPVAMPPGHWRSYRHPY